MITEHNKTQFDIQRQFKKDFGFTLEQAEKIAADRRRDSDEVYYLNCLLGGLDIKTSNSVNLSEDEKKIIKDRLIKINNGE